MTPASNAISRLRNKFVIMVIGFFVILFIFLQVVFDVDVNLILNIAVGVVVSLLDTAIMFWGVKEGSKQSSFEQARSIMQKNMFKRIIFLATIAVVLMKLTNVDVFWLFIVFLFLHVCFIGFLVLNMWSEMKEI